MSKLAIQSLIIGTILILWGIFMLSIHYKHKKRMKEIEEEWEERRRRWRVMDMTDEVNGDIRRNLDRQWNELNRCWRVGGRPSAMVPCDEVKRTDKLSPPKKMGKHTMR